jgi:hypothetical protein
MIHAKHADGQRLNDLSGRMIGCAFTVLDTLGSCADDAYHALIAIKK